MRLKLGLLSLTLIAAITMQAQVAIGTSEAPEQFAALQIDGVNQGLRLSTLTTSERNNLAVTGNPAAMGLMIYNTTTSAIEFYDGSQWQPLSNNISAVINGIHRDPTDGIELGGPLTESTTIAQEAYAMNFTTNGGTFSVNSDALAVTDNNVSVNADNFVVKNGSNDIFKITKSGATNAIAANGMLSVNNVLSVIGNQTTINGTLTYVDGTQGVGKVLTSNANGAASWQTLQPVTSTKTFSLALTEFTSSGGPSTSQSSQLLTNSWRSITNGLYLEPGKWVIAGTLYTYTYNRNTNNTTNGANAPIIEMRLYNVTNSTVLYQTGNVPELKNLSTGRDSGAFAAIPMNCLIEVPAGGLTLRIDGYTTLPINSNNRGIYLIRNYNWLNPGTGNVFKAVRVND